MQTGKEYLAHVLVVDFDVWIHLCMTTWQKQVDADAAGIRKLYLAYDEDGNGVLSFEVSAWWRVLAKLWGGAILRSTRFRMRRSFRILSDPARLP